MTDRLAKVRDYYTQKIQEHGATPRGVDWNGEESQNLRFAQLMRIADGAADYSLNEIGCGYGALVDFLDASASGFTYYGVDLSEEMIEEARRRSGGRGGVKFAAGDRPEAKRDFCVASGIFNVRLDTPDAEWLPVIHETLDMMHECSSAGFAFNALTKYSDPDKMRAYLFYADPLALFDRCKRRYGRNVALLHDYGLYEFTILVRKNID